jgi:hypothetical protein
MSTEDIETAALKLDAKAQARFAEKLLESLSDEENARLWAEEAQRRDMEGDADPTSTRAADEVFRDARARLK